MRLKLLIFLLFTPILSFSAIEHCIHSKFKELVQESSKKNIDNSELKKIATKVCNSINTEKIVKIEKNYIIRKKRRSNINNVTSRSSKSKCIKKRLNQLGVKYHKGNFEKISELKNIATADCFNVSSTNIQNSNRTRGNSSDSYRDLSNMDFKTCVKNKTYELSGNETDPFYLNQIKDQATRECL